MDPHVITAGQRITAQASDHHFLAKYSNQIRTGAIAAILTVPSLALVRNNRLGEEREYQRLFDTG